MAERKIRGAVRVPGDRTYTAGDEEELNGKLTDDEVARLTEAGEIAGDWDTRPPRGAEDEGETDEASGDTTVDAERLDDLATSLRETHRSVEDALSRIAELEERVAALEASGEEQEDEPPEEEQEGAQEDGEATDEEADTEEGAEATDEDTEDAETTARERWEDRYQVSPQDYLDRYGEDAEGADLAQAALEAMDGE